MTEQQQGPTLGFRVSDVSVERKNWYNWTDARRYVGTDKPEFQMAPLHGRLLARRRETTNVIRGAGSNSA